MPAKEPVVIGSPAFCQWSIRTTDALGRCLFRNDRFRTDQQRGLETSQRQTPTETVEKIQQTPFARFTDTWNNPPVKGHFLLADVERNEVHYRYAPVIPFHVFLFKEYGVLTLQVVDAGEQSGKMPKCG